MTHRIETITELNALERLLPEWELLSSVPDLQTPFITPTWNWLWWKHFSESRRSVHDELRVFAIRNHLGHLIAVAPMMLTTRPDFGPLRTRTLQFFGTDPNITEIRGPICSVEDEPAVVAALNSTFLKEPMGWDWVQWFGLRREPSASEMMPAPVLHDYTLNLPANWEDFRASRSRNIKEALRKCYNSLSRDNHRFTFRVVQRPDEARVALHRFFDLHRARANAGNTVHHEDVFATPRARAFMREYVEAMAERGQLFIFQIEISGEVVATRIGFGLGRSLFMYYSGYDLSWARYSIMTTVLAEAIKWAIKNGYTTMNLSTGTDVSKTRWGPTEHNYYAAVLRSPNAHGRVAYRIAEFVRRRMRSEGLPGLLARIKRSK